MLLAGVPRSGEVSCEVNWGKLISFGCSSKTMLWSMAASFVLIDYVCILGVCRVASPRLMGCGNVVCSSGIVSACCVVSRAACGCGFRGWCVHCLSLKFFFGQKQTKCFVERHLPH